MNPQRATWRRAPEGEAGASAFPQEAAVDIRASKSGVAFRVRTSPDLERAVLRRLPPGSEVSPDLRPRWAYSLHRDGDDFVLASDRRELARATGPGAALDQLEDRLRFDVARTSVEHLFVHAGVVGVGGRAVVIPGSSGAGKSTLVSRLVARGADYYSDEFALIDDRGRVHPYPQKLALAEGAEEGKRRVPVQALGGHIGRVPLPVGVVLVTRYRPGARFRPRVLQPAQAVLDLFAHVVRARAAPQEALARLERAVREARALESDRGEADAAARALLASYPSPDTPIPTKEAP